VFAEAVVSQSDEAAFRCRAQREYLDAMVFYSGSGEKIGVKFADAVELAIAKIGSEPHRFREIEAGVRRCRVTRFPYSILYNIAEEDFSS
jgi:hypothetical protein